MGFFLNKPVFFDQLNIVLIIFRSVEHSSDRSKLKQTTTKTKGCFEGCGGGGGGLGWGRFRF